MPPILTGLGLTSGINIPNYVQGSKMYTGQTVEERIKEYHKSEFHDILGLPADCWFFVQERYHYYLGGKKGSKATWFRPKSTQAEWATGEGKYDATTML